MSAVAMTWVQQRGLSHVVAMIVVHHKAKAIALRVTVGHVKEHRVVTDHISHDRIRVSVKGHRVVTGHTSHGRIRVSVKGHRVVTGHINHGRIRVSVKGHRAGIEPIAPKVIAGHAHRAISNSLVHRVARVSGHLRRHAPRVSAMTSTRCRRHRRLAVRQVIMMRCAVGAAG
jgi:hypothetical protein